MTSVRLTITIQHERKKKHVDQIYQRGRKYQHLFTRVLLGSDVCWRHEKCVWVCVDVYTYVHICRYVCMYKDVSIYCVYRSEVCLDVCCVGGCFVCNHRHTGVY